MKTIEEIIKGNIKKYSTQLDTIFVKYDSGINVFAGIKERWNISKGKMFYIYYINIATNPKDTKDGEKDEEINLVSFATEVFSIKFLEGIINYYMVIIDNIIKAKAQGICLYDFNIAIPRAIGTVLSSKSYYINSKDRTDKFLEKNKDKDFTQELMIGYLLQLCNFGFTDKEIKDKAKLISAKYKKDAKYTLVSRGKYVITKRICDYLCPGFFDFTLKETHFISNKGVVDTKIMYKDVKTVKLAYKMFIIPRYPDSLKNIIKGSKVKDCDVNNVRVYKTYVVSPETDFNIKNKEIFDFINNLTIKQLQLITDNKTLREITNPIEFIKYAECIIKRRRATTDKAMAKQLNNAVTAHAENTKSRLVQYFYRIEGYYAPTVDDYYIVKTMIEYFENLDDEKFTVAEIRLLSSIVNGKSKYIYNMDLANWLFYELNNIFTVNEIVELMKEIIINGKPLSIKEWCEFLENYEDYMAMPASWWIRLL